MTAHFGSSTTREAVKVEDLEVVVSVNDAGFYRSYGKRAFDILFVIFMALPALFVVGVAAILTTLVSRQSPFYRQYRVGRNGRKFRMLKLQTMVTDADAVLETHLAEDAGARAEWDTKQKLGNDPRITRIGEILRKTSVDELPQLWNVLKGDMSVIGPRPMMLEQRALYPGSAYYALRPGITGAWQVSDRSKGSFVGRAAYDTKYNQDLSLKTDLGIAARTVGVVLRCTGC